MPANIYNPADFQQTVRRIRTVSPDATRRWGKMDVVQMVEHLCIQLELALGNISSNGFEGPAILRNHFVIKLALYVLLPWPRDLITTPHQMNMILNKRYPKDLEYQKHRLLELLQQFVGTQAYCPHPVMGSLKRKDWGRMIWVHFDHHLRQFSQ